MWAFVIRHITPKLPQFFVAVFQLQSVHGAEKALTISVLKAKPFPPALGRQRQGHICEYDTSLVYRVSSGITKDMLDSVTNKQTNKHIDE